MTVGSVMKASRGSFHRTCRGDTVAFRDVSAGVNQQAQHRTDSHKHTRVISRKRRSVMTAVRPVAE